MKPRLLYIFDPLCGWCYGISGELSKIETHYKDQMEFDAFTGGMVLSDRTGPIAEMQHYILPGIKRIEEMSDMQFGQKYKELVQEGSYFCDSEPACVAFQVIKTLKPEHTLNAAHDILNAHFKDGKNLNKAETYLELLDNYQISEDEFLTKFSDRELIKQTYQEFNFVHQLGISGFPSLVLVFKGTDGHLLAQGYQSFEKLQPVIDKLMKEYA
jgi:putative protein-disulfide isomerase